MSSQTLLGELARRFARIGIESEPPTVSSSFLAAVDCVGRALQLGSRESEERAAELGLLELVERARDDLLAELDAESGLAVLSLPWQAVLVQAYLDEHGRRRGHAVRCARCRGDTKLVTLRGGHARAPNKHFRRSADGTFRARRCLDCGLWISA